VTQPAGLALSRSRDTASSVVSTGTIYLIVSKLIKCTYVCMYVCIYAICMYINIFYTIDHTSDMTKAKSLIQIQGCVPLLALFTKD